MSHNIMIISSSKHPLFDKLSKLGCEFYDIATQTPFDMRESDYQNPDVIFDLTLLTPQKKRLLLERLAKHYKSPIISDLTFHWGDALLKHIPKLAGAVSLGHDPDPKYFEFYLKDDEFKSHVQELAGKLKIEGIQVKKAGCGFQMPRTLSMIINEAYYARQEGVAQAQDIDTAMKFGVNYPKGPFEWCSQIGPRWIVQLLDELHFSTSDPRYKVASSLRLEGKLYPDV